MINLSHDYSNHKIEKKILECETINVINIPKGKKTPLIKTNKGNKHEDYDILNYISKRKPKDVVQKF
jgi:phage FluMu protein Com